MVFVLEMELIFTHLVTRFKEIGMGMKIAMELFITKMVMYIKGQFIKVTEKDLVNIFIIMAIYMKGIGLTTKKVDLGK
jgi:hypothetical protein